MKTWRKEDRQPVWGRTSKATNSDRLQFYMSYVIRNIGIWTAISVWALSLSNCYSNNYASGIVERQGNTIIVRRGGNFQAALDKANPGDTITLESGATFKGSFRLSSKPGAEFITIRSSGRDSELPPPGKRLDPVKFGPALAKVESDVLGEPAILAIEGAHHYRFIGIEFGPTKKGLYNIIQIGSGYETRIEELPHHIEFDRVYIHGSPTEGQRRGIAANGRFLKIQNSHISDIKREGEESQAIAIWASDGNIEITNNYLEAAAENILFGGAKNKMGLVAANCVIDSNWMNKPIEWRETKWVVKNFIEVKSGRSLKFNNNLLTNNWAMGQEGVGVLFRTAIDSGDQAIVEDIEFTNNVMRGSGSAFNLFGPEGRGARNITIRNNIFTDISSKRYGGRGSFLLATETANTLVENNTVIHDGSIMVLHGEPMIGLVFQNNIVFNNEYGIFGDGLGSGRMALQKYAPGSIVSNNVIIGGERSAYGASNFYPLSERLVGFLDPGNGDYSLRSDSPYIGRGVQGGRIGADLDPKTVGTVKTP